MSTLDPVLARVLLGMLLTLAGTIGIVLTLSTPGNRARTVVYGVFVWLMTHVAVLCLAFSASYAGWFR